MAPERAGSNQPVAWCKFPLGGRNSIRPPSTDRCQRKRFRRLGRAGGIIRRSIAVPRADLSKALFPPRQDRLDLVLVHPLGHATGRSAFAEPVPAVVQQHRRRLDFCGLLFWHAAQSDLAVEDEVPTALDAQRNGAVIRRLGGQGPDFISIWPRSDFRWRFGAPETRPRNPRLDLVHFASRLYRHAFWRCH